VSPKHVSRQPLDDASKKLPGDFTRHGEEAFERETPRRIPPFVTLAVGQSTSAAIKGGREQVVTILPEGCGAPNTPLSDPISYTVSVEHPG